MLSPLCGLNRSFAWTPDPIVTSFHDHCCFHVYRFHETRCSFYLITRETLAPKSEVMYLSSGFLGLPIGKPGLEDLPKTLVAALSGG